MSDSQLSLPQASPQQQETPQHQESPGQTDNSLSLPESPESPNESGGDEIQEALAKAAKEALDDGDDHLGESEEAEASGEADDTKGNPEQRETEARETENAPSASKEPDRVKPSALASFHRQQKEFQAKVQAFNAEKAELQKFREVLDNAKVDRLAALELMGYTDVKSFLESVVEDGGRMTPERRELQNLKKWKEEQEIAQKQQQEQWRAQQEQAAQQAKLDALHSKVKDTIKSEAYTGRLINLDGSDEQVMQEMDKMALETGEMPDIADAIDRVEARFKASLEQMAGNAHIRTFFQEKLKDSKSGSTAPSQSKPRGKTKTITSDIRAPGLKSHESNGSFDDEDKEFNEALAFLRASSN